MILVFLNDIPDIPDVLNENMTELSGKWKGYSFFEGLSQSSYPQIDHLIDIIFHEDGSVTGIGKGKVNPKK